MYSYYPSIGFRTINVQYLCQESSDFFFSQFQAFVATGTNLQLSFMANAWSDKPEDRIPTRDFVDFDREPGKVSFLFLVHSYFI